MSSWIIGILVVASMATGYGVGLAKRMEAHPELQGKGLRILFRKDK